jgi:spore germination protein KA
MKKLSDWLAEAKQKNEKSKKQPSEKKSDVMQSTKITEADSTLLDKQLTKNTKSIRERMGGSGDLVVREFSIGDTGRETLAIVYIDGMADATFIQDVIMRTLMIDVRNVHINDEIGESLQTHDLLARFTMTASEFKKIYTIENVLDTIIAGDTAVLIDGETVGFSLGSKGWEKRGVDEPTSQNVVRGPKEGFTETLRTNTALIRRKIKDPNLWFEQMQVGRHTKTEVTIAYIKEIVNEDVLKEVKLRLNRIDIDAILESGYIEEMIQDETYSPFPTIYNTERPDSVASMLLEGRVAILVDGTPFVLVVPALFVQFFQATEDYYQRADISTLIRLLRFVSFLLALLVPASYIAVTTFHQEMLPTTLLISLAAQREGVPFPAFIEALLMEVTFEILREAGIRMPKAVGSAISIVGALVLGQAAVEAGIVSAAMVIVVSLTAISSFVSPEFNMSISVRILRFMFMILAASFGLFGIILGLIVMITHLVNLRSFGIPYLSPMAPFIKKDQKDALIRFPHWDMRTRPRLISQANMEREETKAPQPDDTSRTAQQDVAKKDSSQKGSENK